MWLISIFCLFKIINKMKLDEIKKIFTSETNYKTSK